MSAGKEAAVLVDLGLVEQPFRAVSEVFERVTVTDVASRYGVGRRPSTDGSEGMQTEVSLR
jgi:hypothetical protein